MSLRRAINRLVVDDFDIQVRGSGVVVSQVPAAGQRVQAGATNPFGNVEPRPLVTAVLLLNRKSVVSCMRLGELLAGVQVSKMFENNLWAFRDHSTKCHVHQLQYDSRKNSAPAIVFIAIRGTGTGRSQVPRVGDRKRSLGGRPRAGLSALRLLFHALGRGEDRCPRQSQGTCSDVGKLLQPSSRKLHDGRGDGNKWKNYNHTPCQSGSSEAAVSEFDFSGRLNTESVMK